jgi:hypothetical protein
LEVAWDKVERCGNVLAVRDVCMAARDGVFLGYETTSEVERMVVRSDEDAAKVEPIVLTV